MGIRLTVCFDDFYWLEAEMFERDNHANETNYEPWKVKSYIY